MADFQGILHPPVKPVVKRSVERLKENPFLGKPLEKELSGYYSLRRRRFRIIYDIDHDDHAIQADHVGQRRDVYEFLRELLNLERDA